MADGQTIANTIAAAGVVQSVVLWWMGRERERSAEGGALHCKTSSHSSYLALRSTTTDEILLKSGMALTMPASLTS